MAKKKEKSSQYKLGADNLKSSAEFGYASRLASALKSALSPLVFGQYGNTLHKRLQTSVMAAITQAEGAYLHLRCLVVDVHGLAIDPYVLEPLSCRIGGHTQPPKKATLKVRELEDRMILVAMGVSFLRMNSEGQDGLISQNRRYYGAQLVEAAYIKDGYYDADSEYSYKRMVQSANFGAFWAKEFGDDPMGNPDTAKRFDLQAALAEGERFYEFFRDTLKFVERDNSWTDKYKTLFYVTGGDGGTAFGGGAEEKVGIFWTPPIWISKAPYAALAHELGHAFQYMWEWCRRIHGGNDLAIHALAGLSGVDDFVLSPHSKYTGNICKC